MEQYKRSLGRVAAVLASGALLLGGAGLAACDGGDSGSTSAPEGTDKSGDAPSLGKADQAFGVLEAGRFEEDGAVEGVLDGSSAQAFRFQTWGETRVHLTLTSPTGEMDPYLVIDGPLPGGQNQIVEFNDDRADDDFASELDVVLTEPGVYRILAGSWGTFGGHANDAGAYRLEYACLESCEMPQIYLANLIDGFKQELGEEAVQGLVEAALGDIFPNAEAAGAVQQQVEAFLAAPWSEEQFPKLPLDLTDSAQGLFESPEPAGEPPAPRHFDVAEILLQGCQAKRSELKPAHPSLPGLMTGSVADLRIDECTLERTQAFAEVLNNLALDNGSTVTHEGQTFTTIEAVFEALLAAGHHVSITNDRFFADFMGLNYQGAAVIAPLWLETTIPLPDGRFLALPSPHTHHTIEVRGPLVNARIMYYMGVSAGVSFRAVGNQRSPWTGIKTTYTYDSDEDPDAIVRLMVTAGELRKKWAAEGASLPAEGYGALGVCNDSTAVLEYSEEGTTTIFPLAHPLIEGEGKDPIDALLAAIPSDVSGYEVDEALQRLLQTLPADDWHDLPFPSLVADLEALTGG